MNKENSLIKNIDTLLIAVDLLSDNKSFLQKTCKFVNFLKCSVVLLYVKEELPHYAYFSESNTVSDEELKLRLKNVRGKFKEKGIEVAEAIFEKGRPHRLVCETADKLDVSAVVLSTGANFHEKKLIGNTADKVIRMSNKNIILINQQKETYSNKVICAFDFSESSENALKLSSEFANISQRSLSVMHVINKIYFSSSVYGSNRNRIDHLAKIDKIESSAQNRLKETADSILESTENIEFIIQQGIPAVQICATVKKQHADWLFIGGSGHSDFVKLFMGSTVEEVYRTAAANIFILKSSIG